MSLPIRDLARDTQWLPGPVRLRQITPKLLICQIGVILNRNSRFHQVESAGTFAYRKFGTPCGCMVSRRDDPCLDNRILSYAADENGPQYLAYLTSLSYALRSDVTEDRSPPVVFCLAEGHS